MSRGVTWPKERRDEFERRWNAGEGKTAIRRAMQLTAGQVNGRIRVWNLHPPQSRRRNHNPYSDAVVEGRSRFPGTVTDEGQALKSGANSVKLGERILKGAWRGFPIYSLTIEERKTCPRSCPVYAACYGDSMHWAKRMRHGDGLEGKVWGELGVLQRRHRRGFAVRLHALGDFWNAGNVAFWREAIDAFPGLHVFGYTAWPHKTKIGAAVKALRDAQWDRFAVRTSGALTGPRTLVIERPEQAGAAIICPAQTGATRSCGSCGLCWAAAAREKPVAFLRH